MSGVIWDRIGPSRYIWGDRRQDQPQQGHAQLSPGPHLAANTAHSPPQHHPQSPDTSKQHCSQKTSISLQKSKNQPWRGHNPPQGWGQLSTGPDSAPQALQVALAEPPSTSQLSLAMSMVMSPELRRCSGAVHPLPGGAGWGHPGAGDQGRAGGQQRGLGAPGTPHWGLWDSSGPPQTPKGHPMGHGSGNMSRDGVLHTPGDSDGVPQTPPGMGGP